MAHVRGREENLDKTLCLEDKDVDEATTPLTTPTAGKEIDGRWQQHRPIGPSMFGVSVGASWRPHPTHAPPRLRAQPRGPTDATAGGGRGGTPASRPVEGSWPEEGSSRADNLARETAYDIPSTTSTPPPCALRVNPREYRRKVRLATQLCCLCCRALPRGMKSHKLAKATRALVFRPLLHHR